MRIRYLGRGLAACWAVLMLSGCDSGRRDPAGNRSIAVKAAAVDQREIPIGIKTSGLLAAESEIKLSFKTGGIIEHILVDEGDHVGEGCVLARLDLSEIEAEVDRAFTAYRKADRDMKRIERLYADTVATLEQLQDARTAVEVAASNLKIARFNLEHSTIKAPTDGRILKRFVETNELVSAGLPVFIFGATGEKWIVRCGVTDREVTRVELGDSGIVSFDAYEDRLFPAVVSEIAEFADPMSGTYEVELGMDDGGCRLVSGFVAKIEIVPARRRWYHVVPIEALVEAGGDRGFVFVLEGGGRSVRKAPIRIGMVLGDEVAVTSGLEGVDSVVTEGAPYLRDGARVRVTGAQRRAESSTGKE
jgi:RND family efflux transporter MFP subunit